MGERSTKRMHVAGRARKTAIRSALVQVSRNSPSLADCQLAANLGNRTVAKAAGRSEAICPIFQAYPKVASVPSRAVVGFVFGKNCTASTVARDPKM